MPRARGLRADTAAGAHDAAGCWEGAPWTPRRTRASAIVLAALLTGLLASHGSSAQAFDETAGDVRVRHLAVDLVIEDSGDVLVTETYQWDFDDENRRGFTRELTSLVPYPAGGFRSYAYSDFTASSPSGAPAELEVTDSMEVLTVEVGAPELSSLRVDGLQAYVLSYRVTGALDALVGAPGTPATDELSWNLTGDQQIWSAPGESTPVDQIEVTVTGPVAAERAQCRLTTEGIPCTQGSAPGQPLSFSASDLPGHSDLIIDVGYPGGTFARTEPLFVSGESYADRYGNDCDPSEDNHSVLVRTIRLVAGGLVAGGVVAGGVVAILVVRRRRPHRLRTDDTHARHESPGS